MRDQRAGSVAEAAAGDIDLLLEAAALDELPGTEICLKIARALQTRGEIQESIAWTLRSVETASSFRAWSSAAGMLRRLADVERPRARATNRVAIAGSYTTSQLAAMLPLAALQRGIDLEVHEGLYAQYQQDLIDPASALYASEPDHVLIAVHEGAAQLPPASDSPAADVEAELARWRSLWDRAREGAGAGVIQHNFALPVEAPYGHLSGGLPGSRQAMLQALNHGLAEAAGGAVSVVDVDRLAAHFGRSRWFDDRYWFRAKQAVALEALPLLVRHTAAVLAARLGLSRKVLVLDLDNTLWGGVIGEDGLDGIKLGGDAEGEAFVAFQEYVLALKERGVILAVASKNNEADVREVFESHPEMRIRLDDIATLAVNWEDKPANLRRIAQSLDVGLDSLVLADDNPGERQIVRRLVPEVGVLPLPPEAADYRRALAEYLEFETAAITAEDRSRTAQYRARAAAAELASSAADIESFYRDLRMTAVVAPFDDLHLPRITQLIGKTNQFNVTTRRHSADEVRRFAEDAGHVTLYLELRDRLAEHGLVAVAIAEERDDALDLDTLLMSCRVIGRTVEEHLLMHLCRAASERGLTKLRGTFVPTAKNHLVRDLFERFGFTQIEAGEDGTTRWEYDIEAQGPITNDFIEETRAGGD